MILAFTGTQEGMTDPQKLAVWYFIIEHRPTVVRHGDCIGADADFHKIATDLRSLYLHLMDLKIEIHPPIRADKRALCEGANKWHDPQPYLMRNHVMVETSDVLIATPGGPEVMRSGTWATIRYARKIGTPRYIVMPDGRCLNYLQKDNKIG